MNEIFNGRVIVITGATGTLGTLAARTFAERGASLALLDHSQDRLDTLVSLLNLPDARLYSLAADLRSEEAVHSAAQAIFDKFGRVDALLHLVAGGLAEKPSLKPARMT